MKILFVTPVSKRLAYKDHLLNSMQNNTLLSIDIIYNDYNKPFLLLLLNRIMSRFFKLPFDLSNQNSLLFNHVIQSRYDILFIVKGNTIKPSTLHKIKSIAPSTKIVGFSNDNMYKWHNKSLYFHYGQKYYDIFYSIKIDAYKKIETYFKRRVIYLDKCYSKYIHKPIHSKRKHFLYDVVFIGSYEKDRFNTLVHLTQNGITIDVFGNMWEKIGTINYPQGLKIHYKEKIDFEYVETIFKSKITLGFLRKINQDTQTSRSIEIPACGGFMLMERTDNHLRLFHEGKEAEFFENDIELLEKIRYYLKHDDKRELIAANGRKRCEKSKYDYDTRIEKMVGDFKGLLNEC